MNQRACHARRFASRWPIPCYTPPPPLSHKQLNGLSKSIVISEVGSLCASGSGSSHAQSSLTMTTVVARAMKTPDRHTCCGKKEQQVRRSPLRCGFATSTLRSCCALTPSPASPHEPRRTSSARLMQIPMRSRAFHAAHAPRQRLTQACAPGHPDKSGFHGVEHPSSPSAPP